MSFELKRKQVCFCFPPVLGSLCKMSYAKVVLGKVFQKGRLLGFILCWPHFVKTRCSNKMLNQMS